MPLSAIWQIQKPAERDWIKDILGASVGEHVFDGEHRLVMDNALVVDNYLYSRDQQYFARFLGKNAFLLHLSDETFEGNYKVYRNFRGVFRNYWASFLPRDRVLTIPLGYESGTKGPGGESRASTRPFVWSFVGAARKSTRPDMVRALDGIQPFFTRVTDAAIKTPRCLHPAGSALGKAEYRSILEKSAFARCPMGNVNLETFRIYEALEAGSIPIVERRLALDYFRNLLGDHPLPSVRSWVEARRLLLRMARSPAQLDALQATCVEWWLRTKSALGEQVSEFIERSKDCVFASRSPYVENRLWQAFELTRHHSASALARRVGRQCNRMWKERRVRATYGLR